MRKAIVSIIQYLISGGIANIGGDLPKDEQKLANEIVKSFGEKVRKYALTLQVPASLLNVQQCTYLFVAKDTANFHFVFVDARGANSLIYRNFSDQGRLELQTLVHQLRIEVGEVVWAFSCPVNVQLSALEEYIQLITQQYANTLLQSLAKMRAYAAKNIFHFT